MTITQRSIHTKPDMTAQGLREFAVCPFCDNEVTGGWDDTTGWLLPLKWCHHFRGFIGGSRLRPEAMFEGVYPDGIYYGA